MVDTAGEVRTNSWATFLYEPLPTHVQVLDGRQELIYNLRTQDVVKKIYRERWMIGTNDLRESGKSVLAARHDDDDDDES